MTSAIRPTTSVVTSSTCNPAISMWRERQEDKRTRGSERSPLAGGGVLSLGWVGKDDRRRARARSQKAWQKRAAKCKVLLTHTHKSFYGQDWTDGEYEKGSIHLQTDIRKGYPASSQTDKWMHTHMAQMVQDSWQIWHFKSSNFSYKKKKKKSHSHVCVWACSWHILPR